MEQVEESTVELAVLYWIPQEETNSEAVTYRKMHSRQSLN